LDRFRLLINRLSIPEFTVILAHAILIQENPEKENYGWQTYNFDYPPLSQNFIGSFFLFLNFRKSHLSGECLNNQFSPNNIEAIPQSVYPLFQKHYLKYKNHDYQSMHICNSKLPMPAHCKILFSIIL